MLEFLLKTFKTKKKFTGVNRRHRRVNMQKKKKKDGWKLWIVLWFRASPINKTQKHTTNVYSSGGKQTTQGYNENNKTNANDEKEIKMR